MATLSDISDLDSGVVSSEATPESHTTPTSLDDKVISDKKEATSGGALEELVSSAVTAASQEIQQPKQNSDVSSTVLNDDDEEDDENYEMIQEPDSDISIITISEEHTPTRDVKEGSEEIKGEVGIMLEEIPVPSKALSSHEAVEDVFTNKSSNDQEVIGEDVALSAVTLASQELAEGEVVSSASAITVETTPVEDKDIDNHVKESEPQSFESFAIINANSLDSSTFADNNTNVESIKEPVLDAETLNEPSQKAIILSETNQEAEVIFDTPQEADNVHTLDNKDNQILNDSDHNTVSVTEPIKDVEIISDLAKESVTIEPDSSIESETLVESAQVPELVKESAHAVESISELKEESEILSELPQDNQNDTESAQVSTSSLSTTLTKVEQDKDEEMGLSKILLVVIVVLTGIFVGIQIGGAIYSSPPSLPQLDPEAYWGPGKYKDDDPTVKAFQIGISAEDVKDLEMRLNLPLRLHSPLEEAQFTYGFNSETLEKIIDYWRKDYGWEKREKHLNTYTHYKTEIEGLNIHFMRAKPSVEPGKDIKIVPLLLIHGWPGSFVEFYDIIPKLIEPQEGSDVIFDVTCPSIPGYGFSDAPAKIGGGTAETGQIFLKLMKRLGFNEFYLQGGDWGSIISTDMATMYKDNILGVHLNMAQANTPGASTKWFLGNFLPSGLFMDSMDEHKMYPLGEKFSFLAQETGYMHIQATKPDTIGHALDQSPVSLAVYILEKFSTWTHKQNIDKSDGGLLEKEFPISLDAMLDNICIYWFTGSITSSTRYYAENINAEALQGRKLDLIPCHVPSGFAVFPQELFLQAKALLAHKFYNIVSYNDMEVGGHFPAMERPHLLAADLHQFVSTVEKRKRATQVNEKKNEL